jgi:transmembrane sensor
MDAFTGDVDRFIKNNLLIRLRIFSIKFVCYNRFHNEMKTMVNKQLLFEHFANKTMPLQKRQIEEWLQKEKNQEQFYQWLVEWEIQSALYQPDVEQPLQRFVQHMETSSLPLVDDQAPVENSTPEKPAYRLPFWNRWLVAASLALLLLFSAWIGRTSILFRTYRTTFGETRTLKLEDGSRVVLNANSSLQIPRFRFGTRTREVLLRGEAFFAITHTTDNQKFLVKTEKGFDVTVHGTEFTVYTRSEGAKVALEKGKVAINYTIGSVTKEVTLKPGDLVILDRQNQPKLKRQVDAQKYSAWKEHRFVFDDMTLRQFGDMLNETYGLQVDIPSDKLAQRTLVGSFQADDADELLKTIADIFNLKIERQKNHVILLNNVN